MQVSAGPCVMLNDVEIRIAAFDWLGQEVDSLRDVLPHDVRLQPLMDGLPSGEPDDHLVLGLHDLVAGRRTTPLGADGRAARHGRCHGP